MFWGVNPVIYTIPLIRRPRNLHNLEFSDAVSTFNSLAIKPRFKRLKLIFVQKISAHF